MIKFSHVNKTFGDIVALKDISFRIKDGDFVFITGPSGAGKTTIIRLILSEILPTTGEIFFDKQNLAKLPKKKIPNLRQGIGVVFQDYKLLPERTVTENIEIVLAVQGLSDNEWEKRIKSVLELVNLTDRADLFPAQLSGGELQRATLARALVGNPKVLLADEPTGNLDLQTSLEIMEILQKINEKGKTVIMATHHPVLVDKLRKRVIELDRGKVVRDEKNAGYKG